MIDSVEAPAPPTSLGKSIRIVSQIELASIMADEI